MTNIVTRFAPSPTGYLHIGGARTALFNWLFARHHGGQFLLRIEDTDRTRSTTAAKTAIVEGLDWLGLDFDGAPVFQSQQIKRHQQIAQELLDMGKAYRCFLSTTEQQQEKENARSQNRRFTSVWRDTPADKYPMNQPSVIRLKAPVAGVTKIDDQVQGQVEFQNQQLDDLVLLRADATPTYMLAVVVDDHDMSVTHIIRGDDHLVNAARQSMIYQALDWKKPVFAHIPLIFGPDGKKLSKRHGALGVEAYRELGYLPEAMRNYLLRLGWSDGDQEFFNDQQAIAAFSLSGINKGPSRLDFDKMAFVNSHYIACASPERLAALLFETLMQDEGIALNDAEKQVIQTALPHLSSRAKLMPDLLQQVRFLVAKRPLILNKSARKAVTAERISYLNQLVPKLTNLPNWDEANLQTTLQTFATDLDIGFGKFGPILRAAISGGNPAPDLALACSLLGRKETLGRIDDLLNI